MISHFVVVPIGQLPKKLDFIRVAVKTPVKSEEVPLMVLKDWLDNLRGNGKEPFITDKVVICHTKAKNAPYPPQFTDSTQIYVYPIEHGVGIPLQAETG